MVRLVYLIANAWPEGRRAGVPTLGNMCKSGLDIYKVKKSFATGLWPGAWAEVPGCFCPEVLGFCRLGRPGVA